MCPLLQAAREDRGRPGTLAAMAQMTWNDAGVGAWRRESRTVVRPGIANPPIAVAAAVISAESEVAEGPLEWEPHVHPMHELVWVRGGTMTARAGNRVFIVSDGEGLWLPAEQVHAGRLTAKAEFHTAFFSPELSPVSFERPTVVTMNPLLESLLTHLARTDLDNAARARAESVVFDALEPSAKPGELPFPCDSRIKAIAESILRDPRDRRSLEDWAAETRISERTITRAFRSATGLTFAQWRRALRVHEALALLSIGHDVQTASELLGYAHPSTFIAAFRQVMGTTPGAFLRMRQ